MTKELLRSLIAEKVKKKKHYLQNQFIYVLYSATDFFLPSRYRVGSYSTLMYYHASIAILTLELIIHVRILLLAVEPLMLISTT